MTDTGQSLIIATFDDKGANSSAPDQEATELQLVHHELTLRGFSKKRVFAQFAEYCLHVSQMFVFTIRVDDTAWMTGVVENIVGLPTEALY